MDKIKIKLVKSDDFGFFHDSRADVRKLKEVVNILIDKVNQLVDAVNEQKKSTDHEKTTPANNHLPGK